ncbi:uncharacterized protein [Nicotiana sylvestris]|uniref:uncharacterized protein n=1 Tax=Nicotiana sylvestris TaxID=4096 RepID=UPI00388CE62D
MLANEEVADNQTIANPVDQVDHHHPLYIHPSDTQGFVLGTCKKSNYDVSLHDLWDRYNAIVLAWFMNTVASNLISTVIYASDAYAVWEDLRERFDKECPVSVYFSRLRELWDEYETLTPPPSCGCPESKKYVEHYQLQKLYQFLTGLHDSYENAKNQVFMTRPLPNLNQAYAMIINVESQRITKKCVNSANDNNEATAVMSNRAHNSGHNGGYNNPRGYTNTNYSGGYKPKDFFNKSTVQCDYCKCKGHTKVNCFKLHGYPSDFKSKRRGGSFNAQENNVNINLNHMENSYGNLHSET